MAARYSPLEMIARLVSFDTVSARSNLPLIDFVEAYLKEHGIPFWKAFNASGDKAALLATIGPSDRAGVCLSGHTDVVPVDDQIWTTPAFTPVLRDGRLYGRGTCDMKGFIGTALALAPDFAARGLKIPIHLCLSYDEEVTCLGSLDLIARFGQDIPMPRACIVGEPTGMDVVDAQKSLCVYTTVITGRAAHSSMPERGAHALFAAARFTGELERYAEELKRRGDPSGRFDPAYSTLHAGLFQAGEAINIIPSLAKIQWECRGVPFFDQAEALDHMREFAEREILPRLQAVAPDAAVTTRMTATVPALAPDPGSFAETLALRLAGRNRTQAVSYGTEAGQFQRHGIPTVICGPGSIEQAHQPDEWIALDEIAACEAFLRRLATELSDQSRVL